MSKQFSRFKQAADCKSAATRIQAKPTHNMTSVRTAAGQASPKPSPVRRLHGPKSFIIPKRTYSPSSFSLRAMKSARALPLSMPLPSRARSTT